jgi:predicted transcriptional regulator
MLNNQKVNIVDVLLLVKNFMAKEGNLTGGTLHMVLSNKNIRDSDIEFCLKAARDKNDTDGIEIAELLIKMSRTQRLKICHAD